MLIEYVFALGWRCNCPNFLYKYDLRRFGSPFDWQIIDFETCCINIRQRFEGYLTDLVEYHPNTRNPLSDKLNPLNRMYMTQNWNPDRLMLNTKFMPENPKDGNLYNWEKLCLFRHYEIFQEKDRAMLEHRIERFNKIMEGHSKKILLIYISRIIDPKDIEKKKQYYLDVVNRNGIKSQVLVIMCIGGYQKRVRSEKIGKVVICYAPVPTYEAQANTCPGTDNEIVCYKYKDGILSDAVFRQLKKYYKFELVDNPNKND
jgi:hypothetical protein